MTLRHLVPLALFLLVVPLAAQEANEPSRGPDRGTDYRVHGIQVLPATGRPFSARDHIEWTRNLEGDTVVKTELYALVARDGQGRIYREHRSFVPMNWSQPSRMLDLVILDPVAHRRTICIVRTKRCTVTAYHASATFVLNPDGLRSRGTRFLTRENLGSDVVEGLDVTGVRETLQISPGAVGNNQTLITTRDFWYYSPLQVNLAVIRRDPRFGTQVLQLVEISLAEPDPKLFRVPSGFTIAKLAPESKQPAN